MKICEDGAKLFNIVYLSLLKNLSMESHFHVIVREPIMIALITCLAQDHLYWISSTGVTFLFFFFFFDK